VHGPVTAGGYPDKRKRAAAAPTTAGAWRRGMNGRAATALAVPPDLAGDRAAPERSIPVTAAGVADAARGRSAATGGAARGAPSAVAARVFRPAPPRTR
jgi:hypothetical protein